MASRSSMSQLSPLAVFRHQSFALLWMAQFVSTAGSGLTCIAAAVLVFRSTGSVLSVGLMLLVTTLPSLLIGLLAGVVVDRIDRRRLMIMADVARACLMALIPLLLPFGIAWLYLLVLLAAGLNQFFDPAQESLLPEMVPDDELAVANALSTISSVGAFTIGASLAGILLDHVSPAWAFSLNALTFLCSAACIGCVRHTSVVERRPSSLASVEHDLRAGLGYVARTPALRSLFLIFAPIFVAFGLVQALLLPFASRTLGANDSAYGLIEGVGLLGFTVGSLLMARLAERLHEGQWIAISITAMGALLLLFSHVSALPLAVLVYLLFYLANAPSYIARRLLIQRGSPRELRGRVSSAFMVTRDLSMMLGMLAVGLADYLEIRGIYLGLGVFLIGMGVLSAVLPGLRWPDVTPPLLVKSLRGE
jgi:MFS family permease